MKPNQHFYQIQPDDFAESPFVNFVPQGLIAALEADNTPWFIYATWLDTRPAGLALVQEWPDRNETNLIWIMVPDPFKRRGLGKGLLQEIEKDARDRGQQSLAYKEHHTEPAVIKDWTKEFLSACGWGPFKLHTMSCTFHIKDIETSPVFQKYYRWAMRRLEKITDYSIFPWSEITSKERKVILSKKKEGWYRDSYDPFLAPHGIEPIISQGVRYKGEVIGWMVGHRPAPTLISYTSLFIDPAHTGSHLSKILTLQAMHNHIQHPEIADGTFSTNGDNEVVVNFLNRITRPVSHRVSTTYVARKGL